jgi:hypothetical protein
MTVDTYTHCNAADVSTFIGDIVTNRVFSGSSSPSLTDVELACDMTAALINAYLAEEGYPLYTDAVLLSTYPRVRQYLRSVNISGACHQILQAVPGMAIDPSDSNAPNARANQFKARFDAGLKAINHESQMLDVMGLQRQVRRTEHITVIQRTDPVTGYIKDPFFKRGMTDIPGSRSLESP